MHTLNDALRAATALSTLALSSGYTTTSEGAALSISVPKVRKYSSSSNFGDGNANIAGTAPCRMAPKNAA